MAASLICVYAAKFKNALADGHEACEMANCTCACHVTFKADTLRALDDLMERLSPVFPDDDDLTGPPVIKALQFVSEAVRLYCNVPITMEDAQALVQAERKLSQIICQGMYSLEVEG